MSNNGSWTAAFGWFALSCLIWVVLLMTPIGQALWYFLTGINSVGVD
jgi:hypothetical protein